VPAGGARPGGAPVSGPGQQGVAGELAEGLPVAGDADAPAGQVDVLESANVKPCRLANRNSERSAVMAL